MSPSFFPDKTTKMIPMPRESSASGPKGVKSIRGGGPGLCFPPRCARPKTCPVVGVADASSVEGSTLAPLGLLPSLADFAALRRPSLRSYRCSPEDAPLGPPQVATGGARATLRLLATSDGNVVRGRSGITLRTPPTFASNRQQFCGAPVDRVPSRTWRSPGTRGGGESPGQSAKLEISVGFIEISNFGPDQDFSKMYLLYLPLRTNLYTRAACRCSVGVGGRGVSLLLSY